MLATSFVLVAALACALSAVLPFAIRPLLERHRVIDEASSRSSHTGLAIRGLGVAPMVALAVAMAAVLLLIPLSRHPWLVAVVGLAALSAAVVGLLEDVRGLPIGLRAGVQLGIGVAATSITTLTLGAHWAFIPLGCITIAGFINATNFMDGVNGMSGLHGIVFGLAMAAIGFSTGHDWLIAIGLITGSVFAAFLPWNLSGRKLFLGDVGSYLLGAVVVTSLVAAAVAGVPIVAVGGVLIPYLADTGCTLVRRVASGHSWSQPHREHTYQRLSRTRLGHVGSATLTASFSAACAAAGLLALIGQPQLTLIACGVMLLMASLYLILPMLLESKEIMRPLMRQQRRSPRPETSHGDTPRRRLLHDVSAEEIIGRPASEIDFDATGAYITGKRVLITGAGGSIGSEICRQVQRLRPAEIIMLDRDETALQQIQVDLFGHGLLDTADVVLADIRDTAAIEAVFAARRPEVVFHAAALKHLPMLEQYPDEAWKSNVMGSLNVLEAAMKFDVDTFVNISTDKAANPTSVLGLSKRLAERLTAWAAEQSSSRYLSVRFGNVLGSRGSMLPLFRDLIEAGRPLTVTHPDATRYFMSIPEASQLVLQAGAIGCPGEVLLLDMGEPVRILTIAERMIDLAESDVGIVFTGLRAGEKLHEDLTGNDEREHRPIHPKIAHAQVPPLSPCELVPSLVASASHSSVVESVSS